MHIRERKLTPDEYGREQFQLFAEPVFMSVLKAEDLSTQTTPILVLDLDGTLVGGGGAEEVRDRIDHLLDDGERTIVINLGAIVRVDSAGLGALVQSYTRVTRRGGSMPLVNAPDHFRRLVRSMMFL